MDGKTPGEEVYRACAEASWALPSVRRLWSDKQQDIYVEMMLARPDWRAQTDVAYRARQEAAAQRIRAHADQFAPAGGNIEQQRLRRHLLIAARVAAPELTMQEVADAVMRGDYAACHLDEAGRSVGPEFPTEKSQ